MSISKIARDEAKKNQEKTAKVHINYRNFKQKLDEKENYVTSKINKSLPIWKMLPQRSIVPKIDNWSAKKYNTNLEIYSYQKAKFSRKHLSANRNIRFFTQTQKDKNTEAMLRDLRRHRHTWCIFRGDESRSKFIAKGKPIEKNCSTSTILWPHHLSITERTLKVFQLLRPEIQWASKGTSFLSSFVRNDENLQNSWSNLGFDTYRQRFLHKICFGVSSCIKIA